jgi:ABC-type antimicrobial peptide transport system permease subunit
MLKSYIKMAWRSLTKNKVSSLINIGGLAVGLTTAVLIVLVIANEFSYDKFQANLPDIYQLMKNQKQMDGVSTGSSTPGPLATSLRNDIPGTKYAARICRNDALLRTGDKSLFGNGMYADPDFFRMMTFSTIHGNPASSLEDGSSLVLTERMAKKLFGGEDPMGKTLILNDTISMKVGAIIRDIPANSTIQFDIALPFQVFERSNAWLNKWDDNRIDTWVQLKPSANVPVLNEKLTKMLQTRTEDSTVSLFAYPMSRLRLYRHFSNGQPAGGNIYMVDLLAMIGLFILLIACINFMNLATARSERRAREVGVRKVLGASRGLIILQFLSEALLTAFLSLIVGILMARLLLPAFNQFAQTNVTFDLLDWKIVVGILAIGLFTGLVAGSYPALFLSRFKTVKVLKGLTASGKKGGGLRKWLVTLQFVISIFFITSTIVVYTEINYVHNRPLGYDQENLIDINATGDLAAKFNIFKNEIGKIVGVKEVSAGSDNMLQFGSGITGLDWTGKQPGQEMSILTTAVQYNWTQTMGIKITQGRDFNTSFGVDTANCLLNQASADKMGLKSPYIGAKVGDKTVIGVFQNFVFNNPSGIIAPMMVSLNTGKLQHFYVRIRNDVQWRQTLDKISKMVKKLNPDFPVNFSFTKEGYQQRFEEFSSIGMLASLFGGMAIFISALGLFGLSIFLAERRGKELSIRKVLGASVRSIWLLLSTDFLKPVFIAMVLAVPLTIIALNMLLSTLTYRIQLSWWMFALAGSVAIVIALATVSFQGIKAAFENPVKNLKAE